MRRHRHGHRRRGHARKSADPQNAGEVLEALRKRDTRNATDVLFLLALLAVGTAFGNAQRSAARTGATDRVTALARTALTPVAVPARVAANATSDFVAGIVHARALAAENRRLRDSAHIIEQYTETVSRMERDLDGLRKLVSLPPTTHRKVAADVRGFSMAENRIVLSIGSAEGVKPGLAVMTGAGLIGVVETVEAHRSQALLITSRQQVGAMDVSRNPAPVGIARGYDATTIELTFQDPKAPVQVGDVIHTSGLGELIPRGIVIGKVIRVEAREEYGTTKAIIDPIVDVGSLREVYVVE